MWEAPEMWYFKLGDTTEYKEPNDTESDTYDVLCKVCYSFRSDRIANSDRMTDVIRRRTAQ